jgi:predicted component of viral defense system (DUF524 family)
MTQDGYDMLAIPLCLSGGADAWFVIEADAAETSVDHTLCGEGNGLPKGWKGRLAKQGVHAPILLREAGGGIFVRLLETRGYVWALGGECPQDLDVKSSLKDARKQRWSVCRRRGTPLSGGFTVINHLGYASLAIVGSDGEPVLDIPLEFVSQKIDFDSEYRAMTVDIAAFCEQLLLTWDAPTGLRFSADTSRAAELLLERFLFLRNFLTPDRFGRILEIIGRKPHSRLVSHREWKPAGMARSTEFLSNPSSMLRSWHRDGDRNVPGEVLDVRKEDTHDTAPNRFVKFALGQFRQLCSEVAELKSGQSPIGNEALELKETLDGILGRRFFREIGKLQRLPLDNQTLQKGEGYREVLQAWILTEAAATLNWTGREESYAGSTRDVATLYEYWIFLKLHELLSGFDGMECVSKNGMEEFISSSGGEILINLKSGKASRSCFRLHAGTEEQLCIDLHYERTFTRDDGPTTSRSYSRNFRPDYTLSIYPSRFGSEDEAEAAGKIAHLHFDAKYRVSSVVELFGTTGDLELDEVKRLEKTVSTYQRGDLLKMHTYNDALRKTIGSYVLYPGEGADPEAMRKFHEIAPGVGAMVMKPGNLECLDRLEGFLADVFTHLTSQFTQYRYLADHQHLTVAKKPVVLKEDEVEYKVAKPGSNCVMVWMDDKRERVFKEQGFAYCHAVPEKDKRMLQIEISVEVGTELIPYGGGRGAQLKTKDWRAKVKSAKFLTKDRLCDYLAGKVASGWRMPSIASHYLLFEFEEVSPFTSLDVGRLASVRQEGSRYMAFTCGWSEILESRTDQEDNPSDLNQHDT